MQKIFLTHLKKQLQSQLKGDISVHIVEDTLIVEVNNYGIHAWKYIIRNINIKILTGISSKIVAQEIVKTYKSYILSKYFV